MKKSSVAKALAGLAPLLLTIPVRAHAAPDRIPSDIWDINQSQKYGGAPSITVNRNEGISVTLPANILQFTGPGSVVGVVEEFMDRWAPGMCTDITDLQSPRKNMKVKFAIGKRALTDPDDDDRPVKGGMLWRWELGSYGEATINYRPRRQVVCVTPELVSQNEGPVHRVSDTGSAEAVVPAIDPTLGFDNRMFGLGGHACKYYDDTGRLTIRSEGIPSPGVTAWLQISDGGTKANVPMPLELARALPKLPDCPIGKNHASAATLSLRAG